MNILLVDDSVPARMPGEMHLRKEGHHVVVADDGREAMELFKKENFDLVITDIWMPRMDGLELLRAIKDLSPDTDIMIITGYAEMETSIEALRLGAANYLMKPLNLEELSFAVDGIHRKQLMAQRLRDQEARLAQVGKMADLGLVAAGVAHEINNPNAFIRGNVQTLQKFWKVLDPFLKRAVGSGIEPPVELDFIAREMPPLIEAMLEGTHRIKKIVDSTASFTRYNEDFDFNPVDLNQCIGEAARYLGCPDLSVELDLAANLPPVRGIWEDLVEVVSELLKNSREAARGQENPSIRIRSYQSNAGIVQVQIEDNGIGIPPEYEHRVFTPFFTTDPKIGRPGLGLTKVFALVRGFGGDIFFSSRIGVGTTFTIKLPVHHQGSQAHETAYC